VELLPFLRPRGTRALLIGLGGGHLGAHMTSYGWDVEAVEIDPGVAAIARRYFDYRGECHVEDGRRFLNRGGKTYDFIVLDAYMGEDLPAHLCTRESFDLVRRRLAEDGSSP